MMSVTALHLYASLCQTITLGQTHQQTGFPADPASLYAEPIGLQYHEVLEIEA